MITVTEAETLITQLIQPIQEIEKVPLNQAQGRILALDVSSNLDFPYWDNSAMDGYAVRYEDVKLATATEPSSLTVVTEIPAGKPPSISIAPGEAARIYTGAMVPAGADTIIMQEHTQRTGEKVLITQPPLALGEYIRKKGAFYQAHSPLLPAQIVLNPAEIAVLATAQITDVPVYRRPRVAVFSTGDELISPEQSLKPGQIIDSNQYALQAFVASQGAIAYPLGIVPDNPQLLREKITTAIHSSDLVLSTGGVSVGEYDYVEQILAECGGTIQIRSVAVKPGKPLTVASFPNGCIYFGIPGNPVSALVSCWRFVQPALKKLLGLKNWQLEFLEVTLADALPANGARETYLWGNLSLVEGNYQFHLAAGLQNSANLINLAQTNALAVLEVGQAAKKPGDKNKVLKT